MKYLIIKILAISITVSCHYCLADDQDIAERIRLQLQSEGRDKYDAIKDEGRKPVETMQFFGVKTGMTVLDMNAGAGYNTEMLSAAVGPTGKVYAQNAHRVIRLINGERHNSMVARLVNDRLANVKYFVVDPEDMEFNNVDMAFWGFNMHDYYNNQGGRSVVEYLLLIKNALKPGGVLGISDHVGEPGNDNTDLHRIETKTIINLLERAGFIIETTSDLLGNTEDDHTRSIYAEGLRYYTDRILVKARKPE